MIVYQEKLKVSLGMKLFWGLFALIFFGLGIIGSLSGSSTVYIPCWIVAVFFLILSLAITPKKLILYMAKVEIKLWLGYTVTIPADNIKAVKKLPKYPFVYLSQDVPFKSSWSIPVRIIRKKGFAFVVTPLNPDKFVAEVSKIITSSAPNLSGQPAQMK